MAMVGLVEYALVVMEVFKVGLLVVTAIAVHRAVKLLLRSGINKVKRYGKI